MNIAIYSRKSKFTGKGESIENQIQLCSAYAQSHFNDVSISIYEDEGFSGSNIDRPEFKRLMLDINSKKIDVLMCYRLDRISRNVADFSSTLEILEKSNVAFVSIKEQFDTTSPMGRAMTYISSVFAQLERETIAERVRDNMLQLAKTGRWLGGKTPFGFVSEEISFEDAAGKIRKLYQLIQVQEEVEMVRFLFRSFLEFGSLIKLESFLIKEGITTKKGKHYNLSSLKFILINPVYVVADAIIFDYFTQKGSSIYSEKISFNGLKGIMPYNRTNQSKKTTTEQREQSEWIIAVGKHEPIIDSTTWIETQAIMTKNKDKSFRKVHSQEALLSGLLKCDICGSYMRPKKNRLRADGTKYHYYYVCELKEKSNGAKCNVKNIAGHTLDEVVTNNLKKLSAESSSIFERFDTDKLKITNLEEITRKNIDDIKSKITTNEGHINKLLTSLGEANDTIASKYIINQINTLGAEIKDANELLDNLESQLKSNHVADINLLLMKAALKEFATLGDDTPITKKRRSIRGIIETARWDGENLKIDIFGIRSLGEL